MPRTALKATSAIVAFSTILATGAAAPAMADTKRIVEGLAICILTNGCGLGNKPKVHGDRKRKPSVNHAQRQQNREVQTALNAFNFPVGMADGVLGRKSRSVIRDHQIGETFSNPPGTVIGSTSTAYPKSYLRQLRNLG